MTVISLKSKRFQAIVQGMMNTLIASGATTFEAFTLATCVVGQTIRGEKQNTEACVRRAKEILKTEKRSTHYLDELIQQIDAEKRL